VIRNRPIQAEQAHKGAQQTLCLPPRMAKGEVQHQLGLNSDVGVALRPTAPARARQCPVGKRFERHPDRQVTTPAYPYFAASLFLTAA
jgi:hypothetical protein